MIMNKENLYIGVISLLSFFISEKTFSQVGEPYIHDPSTIILLELVEEGSFQKTDGHGIVEL